MTAAILTSTSATTAACVPRMTAVAAEPVGQRESQEHVLPGHQDGRDAWSGLIKTWAARHCPPVPEGEWHAP
jgi:hypothetical protein